ncbi:macro domain-containing protein [Lactobacillus delbrueckii]|uniref:macro domain-containing protein n=1 Tax=Lactobacillus delbrueckii TaxID=1584 RepID=UPI0034DD8AF5
MNLEIWQGNITTLKVDAIVNAANRELRGGGGVDGAIHRVAGPKLNEACRALGSCETGEAKITPGFNLPAKYIIHTVGPIYSGSHSDPLLLAACYRNSLRVAKEMACTRSLFPRSQPGSTAIRWTRPARWPSVRSASG